MPINHNHNDFPVAPKRINEPHMPVVLLADISGSMDGAPIRNLVRSINRFADDVCKDPLAADIVDIAVIGFNEEPVVQQEWRPISEMNKVEFTANGGTNLSAALTMAVNKLRDRGQYYQELGMEVRMPYCILITDGYGGDVTQIAQVIKQRTADKKMQLWVLCVKGYDKETVATLTDGKRVIELVNEDGYDFTGFFDFMAISIKAVSTSRPDEKIHVENPFTKTDATIKPADVDDWLNN